jgi:flavodoxin
VVYESMYGNTHVIAANIADGLRSTHDGKTFTVTGVRPVSVPGPWVITKIA